MPTYQELFEQAKQKAQQVKTAATTAAQPLRNAASNALTGLQNRLAAGATNPPGGLPPTPPGAPPPPAAGAPPPNPRQLTLPGIEPASNVATAGGAAPAARPISYVGGVGPGVLALTAGSEGLRAYNDFKRGQDPNYAVSKALTRTGGALVGGEVGAGLGSLAGPAGAVAGGLLGAGAGYLGGNAVAEPLSRFGGRVDEGLRSLFAGGGFQAGFNKPLPAGYSEATDPANVTGFDPATLERQKQAITQFVGEAPRPTLDPNLNVNAAIDQGSKPAPTVAPERRAEQLGLRRGERLVEPSSQLYTAAETAAPGGGFNYRVLDAGGREGTVSTERTQLGRGGALTVLPSSAITGPRPDSRAPSNLRQIVGSDGRTRTVDLGDVKPISERVNVIRNTSNTGFGANGGASSIGGEKILGNLRKQLERGTSYQRRQALEEIGRYEGGQANIRQGDRRLDQDQQQITQALDIANLNNDSRLQAVRERLAGAASLRGTPSFADRISAARLGFDQQRAGVADRRAGAEETINYVKAAFQDPAEQATILQYLFNRPDAPGGGTNAQQAVNAKAAAEILGKRAELASRVGGEGIAGDIASLFSPSTPVTQGAVVGGLGAALSQLLPPQLRGLGRVASGIAGGGTYLGSRDDPALRQSLDYFSGDPNLARPTGDPLEDALRAGNYADTGIFQGQTPEFSRLPSATKSQLEQIRRQQIQSLLQGGQTDLGLGASGLGLDPELEALLQGYY